MTENHLITLASQILIESTIRMNLLIIIITANSSIMQRYAERQKEEEVFLSFLLLSE
jgi:hypothetical protein